MRQGRSTGGRSTLSVSERATFYYDLGSPYAYLAAERISGLFTEAELEQPEWQPILLGGLFKRFDRDSWGNGTDRAAGMAEVERRAAAYGLPPLAWPKPWPGNTLVAMRAATFAKQTGRTVSFSLAAFRQAFAAGRDLTDVDNVAIAGAACELHPRALLKAVETETVKSGLREATDRAAELGVEGVPAVVVGDEVFWGDDRLEDAVAAASRT
jgi:2-hydroxychromene-2-carboxylate isomerase